jgi:hypothetical protein
MASATRATREAFLVAYSKLGTIRAACEAIGINRQTVLNWRNADKKFAARFNETAVEFTEALETIAHQRAVSGSDVLLMFTLKKRDPSYRERFGHEHNGRMTLEQLVQASILPEVKP